jgi:hypothetical protein
MLLLALGGAMKQEHVRTIAMVVGVAILAWAAINLVKNSQEQTKAQQWQAETTSNAAQDAADRPPPPPAEPDYAAQMREQMAQEDAREAARNAREARDAAEETRMQQLIQSEQTDH